MKIFRNFLKITFYLSISKIPLSHTRLSTHDHHILPTLTPSIDNFTAWQNFNFFTTFQTLSIQEWRVSTWRKLCKEKFSRSLNEESKNLKIPPKYQHKSFMKSSRTNMRFFAFLMNFNLCKVFEENYWNVLASSEIAVYEMFGVINCANW